MNRVGSEQQDALQRTGHRRIICEGSRGRSRSQCGGGPAISALSPRITLSCGTTPLVRTAADQRRGSPLVLGWIDSYDSNQILMFSGFSRSSKLSG